MRVLITGAGGMLGRDVAGAAAAAGHDVVPLARADLDVTDPAVVVEVIRRAEPDVVVNCAAYTDVDGAESDVAGATAVNAHGAAHVARAAARARTHVIHVSTDYVFDGTKRDPYVESDPTAPRSQYGITKLAGELAVAQAAPGAHTIVRTAWLFGASGRCFPKTIIRAARERPSLSVVDDQIGCPTFTGHLAEALLTLADTRPVGVLHVAGTGRCSWFEFARAIVEAAGSTTEVLPAKSADLERPAPRPAFSILGTERPGEVPVMPAWQAGLHAFMDAAVIT